MGSATDATSAAHVAHQHELASEKPWMGRVTHLPYPNARVSTDIAVPDIFQTFCSMGFLLAPGGDPCRLRST